MAFPIGITKATYTNDIDTSPLMRDVDTFSTDKVFPSPLMQQSNELVDFAIPYQLCPKCGGEGAICTATARKLFQWQYYNRSK